MGSGYNGKQLRTLWFDRYAANLSYYMPEARDQFICPICRAAFGRASLDDEENGPTVEHCIPKAVGGRLYTLTCKRCNNSLGAELDFHLANRLLADDFLAGISDRPMDGEVKIEGHRVRGSVSIRGGENPAFEVQVIKRATNPAELEGACQAMTNSEGGIQGSFSFNLGYNPRLARIALIRSAYLLMFRHYGYGYFFTENTELVRRQIEHIEHDVIPEEAVLELTQFPDCMAPTIVTSPREFRSFVVPVKVRAANRFRVFGVVLPGFDDNAVGLYEKLRADCRASATIPSMRYRVIGFNHTLLTHPEGITPLDIWNETFGQTRGNIDESGE
jgi:HNH endonuclease